MEIVINRYINFKKKIETGISQGSPIPPIWFLFYIVRVFNIVSAIFPKTISILFINDLWFLTSENSIQEGATSLEKSKETVLK